MTDLAKVTHLTGKKRSSLAFLMFKAKKWFKDQNYFRVIMELNIYYKNWFMCLLCSFVNRKQGAFDLTYKHEVGGHLGSKDFFFNTRGNSEVFKVLVLFLFYFWIPGHIITYDRALIHPYIGGSTWLLSASLKS